MTAKPTARYRFVDRAGDGPADGAAPIIARQVVAIERAPAISISSTAGVLKPTVRTAHHRDLARILEIERVSFPQPWSLASFEHELSLPFSRLMVAITDHEAVGGFLCRWLVADECHILNIAVHPDYRRAGIGTRLMSDALAEASLKRVALVTLEVRRSNLAARSLYRGFRFEERRLRHNYYGHGEDAIVMELRLANSVSGV